MGRASPEKGASAAYRCAACRAEVSCAIGSVKEANIQRIEQIKGFGNELKFSFFSNHEAARKAEVYGFQRIALEGVARVDAHTIIVAKDVAIGIEAGELGEVLRRLQSDDGAEEKIPRGKIPGIWRTQRAVGHKAVTQIIGGNGALGLEIFAVLGDEHEAGIRAVVERLRKCVADAVGKIVAQPLVYADEQTVEYRVPLRSRFEIDRPARIASAGEQSCGLQIGLDMPPRASHRQSCRVREIDILAALPATGITGEYLCARVGLVHVEKAAQMHATHMKEAYAQRRIGHRLKLKAQAGLNAVRVLVVLIKTNDRGIAKETALRERFFTRKANIGKWNSIWVLSIRQELV